MLLKPLTFKGHTVPSLFETDGASIPWFAQWLVKKGGELFAPAVLHDYLYRTKPVTRTEADKIFLEAMEYNEVDIVKRTVVYAAVRLFGGRYYERSQGEGTAGVVCESGG